MGFIAWIVIGILAGYIAEKVTKSDHGLLTNLVVGLVGAFVGGFIASRLGLHLVGGFIDQLIVASGGAILVLVVYRAVKK
ncbi:GlsB/YeaQ/YmgE family stress response membrane protein [Coralliovum pocilloporae]|uniref:GlsB/YeaQ/YmgE family stress response membrane protein n=1 Tax=Coralliovum pocilloporae TaxID=3066369 RepID=UPI0033073857